MAAAFCGLSSALWLRGQVTKGLRVTGRRLARPVPCRWPGQTTVKRLADHRRSNLCHSRRRSDASMTERFSTVHRTVGNAGLLEGLDQDVLLHRAFLDGNRLAPELSDIS